MRRGLLVLVAVVVLAFCSVRLVAQPGGNPLRHDAREAEADRYAGPMTQSEKDAVSQENKVFLAIVVAGVAIYAMRRWIWRR